MAKKSESKTSSKPKRINGAKKGKQFERDVSNAIGHIFPAAERMLEYQASGNIGVDIQGTGIFKIQCKRNAGYAPISRIHEVRTKLSTDIPVLVTKGNRMEAMAVLPFDKLIYLLEICHGIKPILKKPSDSSEKEIFKGDEGSPVAKIEKYNKTLYGFQVMIDPSIEVDECFIVAETKGGSEVRRKVPSDLKGRDFEAFVKHRINDLRKEYTLPREIHFGSEYHIRETFAQSEAQVYTERTTKNEGITLDSLI